MFLKSLHNYQAQPIILPYTFFFTKQSDLKESGTKVLKFSSFFIARFYVGVAGAVAQD